ncbi:UBP1-associated protein 2A-like protein, partial [Tanacetum coccineum]
MEQRNAFCHAAAFCNVIPNTKPHILFRLGWDATTDQVLSIFKQHGDNEECKVVTDEVTGKAKGYGCVLFKIGKKCTKIPHTDRNEKKIRSRMATFPLASA